MRKLLTLLATITSLIAFSQRSFTLISPVPVSEIVYFHQNDTITLVMEAYGFDSNYVFNVTLNGTQESSFKYSEFINGKLTKKVIIKGYQIPYDSPVKCMVYNQYFWMIKTNITEVTDQELEINTKYKYYDINGIQTEPIGLVFRSDGKKIIYK